MHEQQQGRGGPVYFPADIRADARIWGVIPIQALMWALPAFFLGGVIFLLPGPLPLRFAAMILLPTSVIAALTLDVPGRLGRLLGFRRRPRVQAPGLTPFPVRALYGPFVLANDGSWAAFIRLEPPPWAAWGPAERWAAAGAFLGALRIAAQEGAEIAVYAESLPDLCRQEWARQERQAARLPESSGLREAALARIRLHRQMAQRGDARRASYIMRVLLPAAALSIPRSYKTSDERRAAAMAKIRTLAMAVTGELARSGVRAWLMGPEDIRDESLRMLDPIRWHRGPLPAAPDWAAAAPEQDAARDDGRHRKRLWPWRRRRDDGQGDETAPDGAPFDQAPAAAAHADAAETIFPEPAAERLPGTGPAGPGYGAAAAVGAGLMGGDGNYYDVGLYDKEPLASQAAAQQGRAARQDQDDGFRSGRARLISLDAWARRKRKPAFEPPPQIAAKGILAVCGFQGGVGRTTVTAHVLAAMAPCASPIVAVDAGRPFPALGQAVGTWRSTGFREALNGAPLEWCISTTAIRGVDLLASGPSSLPEKTDPDDMAELLKMLVGKYAWVVVDTPADPDAGELRGALMVATNVLWVVDGAPAGLDRVQALGRALAAGADHGVVLNRAGDVRPQDIEQFLGMPVVAVIPDLAAGRREQAVGSVGPEFIKWLQEKVG